MLRRIKRRFDELKIDIPFPQRTVWVREEGRAGEESGEPGVGSRESEQAGS
jgi:small-conductance mechanosensitive channel